MTEMTFWKIVESCGWSKKANYNAIKDKLLKHGKEWCVEFEALYRQKRIKLETAALKAGYDFCCDSWDDTLAHTVGLGRGEYLACLKDPQRLVKRMQDNDYKESFSYAVPSIFDFPA